VVVVNISNCWQMSVLLELEQHMEVLDICIDFAKDRFLPLCFYSQMI
jgi:hypothetical protein